MSGATVLHHKRSTVHSIFQISISQNTKCVEMVGFPKDSHICTHAAQNYAFHQTRIIKFTQSEALEGAYKRLSLERCKLITFLISIDD